MKVKYENDRLQMMADNPDEDRFVKTLCRRIEDSNNLMSWYGDVQFDGKETSGYVITWQPSRDPKNIGVEPIK